MPLLHHDLLMYNDASGQWLWHELKAFPVPVRAPPMARKWSAVLD